MADTFDIFIKGEKKGVVTDNNSSIVIESNEECEAILTLLLKNISLNDKSRNLLEKCIKVNAADIGEEINFGPGEILDLSMIAMNYPEISNEVLAVNHYLMENISFEGTIPPNFFMQMADIHTTLSSVFSDALNRKDNDISDSDSDISDSDISDSDISDSDISDSDSDE